MATDQTWTIGSIVKQGSSEIRVAVDQLVSYLQGARGKMAEVTA